LWKGVPEVEMTAEELRADFDEFFALTAEFVEG